MMKTTLLLGCLALIVLLGLSAGEAAAQDDWKPGAPHPSSPHIVAAE